MRDRITPGIMRDVVLILLVDAEGRFLLQHRDDTAATYPGYWGFFGGGIETGEDPIAAIRREAFEELRYEPREVRLARTIEYHDPSSGARGRKFYFIARCPDKTLLELREGQGMKWLTLKEARKLKVTSSNLDVIEELMAGIS